MPWYAPKVGLDIAEVLEHLRLLSTSGLTETLGRLTQLVAELPWLCSLEAQVVIGGDDRSRHPLPLQANLRLTLSQVSARMT